MSLLTCATVPPAYRPVVVRNTAKRDGTDEIEIWGDGEQTRSFMFIDDCVEDYVSDHGFQSILKWKMPTIS